MKKYIVSTAFVTSLTFTPVFAGSVFAYGGPAEVDVNQNNTTVNESTNNGEVTATVTVNNSNLSIGDTGEAVTDIQTSLNNHGANLAEDGIFGSNTDDAVRDFQQSNSLSVDGIVGPETTAALSGSSETEVVDSPDTEVDSTETMVLDAPEPQTEAETVESDVVSVAQGLVGSPYSWGGTSPSGFDSSGFINYAFDQVGIELDRTHQGMWDNNGVHVDNPQPGDVVFFANTYESDNYVTHSGIYLGNNQMIHAGSEDTGVNVADLGIDYWQDSYIGAKSFD